MADAVCGPSNPLQSFQKHTSLDRTLQQDRLRQRTSPGQGFRTPDPRTGSLDADFAAFEAGQQLLPHGQLPFAPAGNPAQQGRSVLQSPNHPGSWATDFQKLRLQSSSVPIPQSQFRTEAPLHLSQPSAAGWHAEFMRQQQSRHSPASAISQPSYSNAPYAFNSQMPSTYSGYMANQLSMPQQALDNRQDARPQEMAMDEAAFESAFAQAESEQMQSVAESEALSTSDIMKESGAVRPETTAEIAENIRIGSDLISERQSPQSEQQLKIEADDLARTAGDLLNALKHDHSEKFQQSQFLNLMRRIRDREVQVQGEDLRETSSATIGSRDDASVHQPLHPGGPYYPEQSPPPPVSSQPPYVQSIPNQQGGASVEVPKEVIDDYQAHFERTYNREQARAIIEEYRQHQDSAYGWTMPEDYTREDLRELLVEMYKESRARESSQRPNT